MKTKLHYEKTRRDQDGKSLKKQLKEKKTSIEDLLVRNLMRTNMQLLKSMDLRSIVLF